MSELSRDERLILIFQSIATDAKILLAAKGDLTELQTVAKNNFVDALNELHGEVQALATANGAVINDAAGNGDTTFTWSADKIFDVITASSSTLRAELLGGEVSEALNTILELATEIEQQGSAALALTTAVGNTVRFTPDQGLSATNQGNARANIGAASKAEHDALAAAVGDTDTDFVAIYQAAKA